MLDELEGHTDLMPNEQSERKEGTEQDGTSTRERSEAALDGERAAHQALEEHRNLPGGSGEGIAGEISERNVQSPTEPPHSEEQFTERNEHWDGVIHYQDARHGKEGHDLPPGQSSPRSSQWDGVQQTQTGTVDLEGEGLSNHVELASPTRSQELAVSHERSLDR